MMELVMVELVMVELVMMELVRAELVVMELVMTIRKLSTDMSRSASTIKHSPRRRVLSPWANETASPLWTCRS
jgi:hypothetical protein